MEVIARSPEMSSEVDSTSSLESLADLFSQQEEESKAYYFTETTHALNILQALNEQRFSSTMCDVIICIEDHEFPCHRNVLAASSRYFTAMFNSLMKEACEKRVHLSEIDTAVMKQIIDYCYTSHIAITRDNAQQLLSASNLLEINPIREACCRFLETEMDPANCLGIHCYAEVYICEELSQKAKAYAMEYFSEVAQHEEICLLPYSKIIEFVSDEELNVDQEEVVLDAVLTWVNFNPEERLPHLAEVMQYIRLPLICPYFLYDKIENEPILTQDKSVCNLLDEAKKFYILKDRQDEIKSYRCLPRKSMINSSIIVAIGGEMYNKNYLNCVDFYDSNENKWGKLKDLPFPRCTHNAVVSDGTYVYVAGGFNKDKVVLNNVLRYERMIDKWVRVTNMNTPRARHGMASLNGCIYAVGGYDGHHPLSSIECYCPAKNTWTYLADMGVAVCRVCAVGYKGYLYVAGGCLDSSSNCTDIVQRFDPRKNIWEMLSPLPECRALAGLAVSSGKIYAIGGTSDMVNASKQLFCYDIKEDKWEESACMVEGRLDAGVAYTDEKIYVLSGHDNENTLHHTMEIYDIKDNIWTDMSITQMPFGRCRFACVAMKIPKI